MKILVFTALFAFGALVCSAKPGEDDTIKKTFKVSQDGTIFLDLDRGTVEVRTTDGNEVHVVLERKVKGVDEDDLKAYLERHDVEWRQDGDRIYVESRFNDEDDGGWGKRKWRRSEKFKLNVTILVPERFNIDFQNGAGNIEIEDLFGQVSGRTGAGNIEIGEITGPVDVMSGAGNITIETVDGEVDVRSGAGNIEISEITGHVNAHTGAGNVIVAMTRQPRGDSDLSSGAGNVTVYMESDISVDVRGRSSLGSARTDFGLKVNGKWMSKSFEGRLNGGGPALVMHSGVGNVNLRKN